jgi:translation initiation factor IF-3
VRHATGGGGGNPWLARKREQKQREEAPAVGVRNNRIPFHTVQLVGATGLGEPEPLARILRGIDTSTHAVVLMSIEPAVVKIVDLEEERAQNREREARAKLNRRMAVEDKEVQVGWTAAEGDMAHKIAIARGALEKGDRVHVIFAMRANSAGGARTFLADERKAQIVGMFDEQLKEVGKRWKEDEIAKGLWICYWAPLETITSEVRRKIVTGEADKKKARDEKKEARRLKEEERLRKAAERQAKAA